MVYVVCCVFVLFFPSIHSFIHSVIYLVSFFNSFAQPDYDLWIMFNKAPHYYYYCRFCWDWKLFIVYFAPLENRLPLKSNSIREFRLQYVRSINQLDSEHSIFHEKSNVLFSVNLPEMLSTGNNRMSSHHWLLMVMRHRIAMIDLVAAAECLLSIDYVLVVVDFALNLMVIHSMERIHYVIPETVIENVAAIESKNFDLENGKKKCKY